VDVGGTWFGPKQTRVAELAREFGIGTYDTYVDGTWGLLPAQDRG
jgi:monoamine oxidase